MCIFGILFEAISMFIFAMGRLYEYTGAFRYIVYGILLSLLNVIICIITTECVVKKNKK